MSEVVDPNDTTICPACGVDWDGGPIPEAIREHYSPPYRWSRRIGLVDAGLDCVVRWKCPDCGNEVSRSDVDPIRGVT